jgi:NitT/TauT family transport system substrate-binding protein
MLQMVWRSALFSVAVLWAAGCSRQETPAATPGAPTGPRKIVFQTDWFPQAEHGGYYQALAKGFYREVGLEVEILPGGPGAGGIKLKTAKGEADFGMLKSDDIMLAAHQGLPLVMVMASMQHDPQALMVHDSSPVKTIRDLDGRTVSAPPGMTWIHYIQKKYGITFNLVPPNYGIGHFLANAEVIQQCIVTNEPFVAQQNGKKVRTIALADSGYDCYPVIFCRRELVRLAPELVRAFVAASIRGWRDYLDGDPAPANRLILERNPHMTAELLRFSRSEMILRSLVHGDPGKGEDIGQLSLARLAEEMQALVDLKVLEAPVAISAVATKEFLPPVR